MMGEALVVDMAFIHVQKVKKVESSRIYHQKNKKSINKRKSEWYFKNKDRISEYKRKYYQDNKEKIKAHAAVRRAIAKGVLEPTVCEHKGCKRKTVIGHHWSYKKEHWLDVQWLCGKHHQRVHRGELEGERK
jgi:hypothetical protein